MADGVLYIAGLSRIVERDMRECMRWSAVALQFMKRRLILEGPMVYLLFLKA